MGDADAEAVEADAVAGAAAVAVAAKPGALLDILRSDLEDWRESQGEEGEF